MRLAQRRNEAGGERSRDSRTSASRVDHRDRFIGEGVRTETSGRVRAAGYGRSRSHWVRSVAHGLRHVGRTVAWAWGLRRRNWQNPINALYRHCLRNRLWVARRAAVR